MQEIRCVKCHKLLCKIKAKNSESVEFDREVTTSSAIVSYVEDELGHKKDGEIISLEIRCPHNYRDENGKNVQCKTLNKIVI